MTRRETWIEAESGPRMFRTPQSSVLSPIVISGPYLSAMNPPGADVRK